MTVIKKHYFFMLFAFLISISSGLGGLLAEPSHNKYSPPSSPPLHSKASSQEPVLSTNGLSGGYLGGGFNLGLSRSATEGSPIAAYGGVAEIGFSRPTGSWNIWEAGIEVGMGRLGHSEATLDINKSVLIKVGYGYSLSSGLVGVFNFGGGIEFADFSNTESSGAKVRSVEEILGASLFGGYSLVFLVSKTLGVSGGIRLKHSIFDLSEVERNGVLTVEKTSIKLNILAMNLGVRFYL